MPLKLILVAPDGTVFADKQVRSDVMTDLLEFIRRMAKHDVQVAMWSRHAWKIGGVPLEDYLSAKSGIQVRYFLAASGHLRARQYAGSVDPILAELDVKRHETILIGGGDTDFKAGVNNGLLLIRPAWFDNDLGYGLKVSSIGKLARFCEVFALRQHPLYWAVNENGLHVLSMGPFSTMIDSIAVFGADARSVAKNNVGDAKFWFLMIVSTLYFSGLAHVASYICVFPGHDPSSFGTTKAGLNDIMTLFSKCLRKTYFPDLILRHTKSVKSQTLSASQRTFLNHLNTIHLNNHPRSYDKPEPRKSPLSLAGKTVLVVDDFMTNGRSLDTARAYINAAGGKAVLFSWLKTINSPYMHMVTDPSLLPFQPNAIAYEPQSQAYGYHPHVIDHGAPQEINEVLQAYRSWKWP